MLMLIRHGQSQAQGVGCCPKTIIDGESVLIWQKDKEECVTKVAGRERGLCDAGDFKGIVHSEIMSFQTCIVFRQILTKI